MQGHHWLFIALALVIGFYVGKHNTMNLAATVPF